MAIVRIRGQNVQSEFESPKLRAKVHRTKLRPWVVLVFIPLLMLAAFSISRKSLQAVDNAGESSFKEEFEDEHALPLLATEEDVDDEADDAPPEGIEESDDPEGEREGAVYPEIAQPTAEEGGEEAHTESQGQSTINTSTDIIPESSNNDTNEEAVDAETQGESSAMEVVNEIEKEENADPSKALRNMEDAIAADR
mmetsp:Transcript_40338/g.65364  ORF Transcript_40338/g.65364 Transcript_40338/m.65364 type:complete len:196 (+) Transcript_40338:206-793(+)|eukprot:CAMPEP_0184671542 /NCGR_PEP_ID=MMETSP0308-20130426/85566_1 /TAXON_ID=38269 /ORGANISM="Gloeochaete witrockiana, Strain SAG 46.84" /LENGTH=195 /DNA_ID=CAMNT_0027118695 /DNA_START=187 /DNA_END=774 /DNA_ORIENTATION=+